MARRTAISFRSVEIEAELDRRYGNRHQGAKQDLLDYYAAVERALDAHPQRLKGLQFSYKQWLADKLTPVGRKDWIDHPYFAYRVACQRLREAHPGIDPFALSQADYEQAGFRIL